MGDLGLSKKGKHMAQEPGSLAFRFAHLVLALLAVIATAVPASGAANRTGKHLHRALPPAAHPAAHVVRPSPSSAPGGLSLPYQHPQIY